MRLPRPAVVVATALLTLPATGCATGPGAADADRRTVGALLEQVETVPRRVHVLGYDRDQFGGWRPRVADLGQLCTTRDLVLFGTFGAPSPTEGTDCPDAVGTATDVYTGGTFSPADAQIDHVVPLAAAWDHGAHAWDRDRRIDFANDTGLNLLAVSADANRAKSDGTPAEWLPTADGPAPCAYVARYLTVSVVYGLSVSTADADAARTVCRR